MKKLLFVLLFALLALPAHAQQYPPTGPAYSFPCGSSIASSWTVAATSTAIQGSSGKGIYICGWHASTTNTSTAATTFQLAFTNSTTNNTCSTTVASTTITPFNAITSTAPSVDHNPVAGLFVPLQASSVVSPSSLCINVGGVANLQLLLYFGQY